MFPAAHVSDYFRNAGQIHSRWWRRPLMAGGALSLWAFHFLTLILKFYHARQFSAPRILWQVHFQSQNVVKLHDMI